MTGCLPYKASLSECQPARNVSGVRSAVARVPRRESLASPNTHRGIAQGGLSVSALAFAVGLRTLVSTVQVSVFYVRATFMPSRLLFGLHHVLDGCVGYMAKAGEGQARTHVVGAIPVQVQQAAVKGCPRDLLELLL